MSSLLEQVQTIVLVMMENRSFDHMLGHLSIDTPSIQVNGLKGDLDQYVNNYNGNLYPIYERKTDDELPYDLPHEFDAVATQLRKNPVSGVYAMDGFVEAFAKVTGGTPNTEADPMGYFPARLTPITDFLARNFCICDNWFASLPTSTQPNRTMAFSGDSSIYQTKTQLIDIPYDLFHWMENHGVRWRTYHDGFSFFSLYKSLWPFVIGEQFKRTEFLYADIQNEPADHAPQVIIIEPNYQDAPHLGSKHPNDNHAPLAIGWGEDFLRRTYQAVTANADKWAHTMMIVYYDEHGGFYDHVPPPDIPYKTIGGDAHQFDSLGPRIPGLIISPLVKPGSICSDLFDHTSVLQLIAEKFGRGNPFSTNVETRKNQGIKSLSVVLNNNLPISPPDVPTVELNPVAKIGKSLNTPPSSDMEKSFELAALELIKQKPAEVSKKFPELIQWKGTSVKSEGLNENFVLTPDTKPNLKKTFVAAEKKSSLKTTKKAQSIKASPKRKKGKS